MIATSNSLNVVTKLGNEAANRHHSLIMEDPSECLEKRNRGTKLQIPKK
jgi:hypothetical protein